MCVKIGVMGISSDRAAYMRGRRLERRSRLILLRGGCCSNCSSVDNLQFHHRDRSQKKFDLSGRGLDTSWGVILDEFEKCDLICPTCHVRETQTQSDKGELTPWCKGLDKSTGLPVVWSHGTAKMYTERSCRCEDCRLARRLYRSKKVVYNQVVSSLL